MDCRHIGHQIDREWIQGNLNRINAHASTLQARCCDFAKTQSQSMGYPEMFRMEIYTRGRVNDVRYDCADQRPQPLL